MDELHLYLGEDMPSLRKREVRFHKQIILEATTLTQGKEMMLLFSSTRPSKDKQIVRLAEIYTFSRS